MRWMACSQASACILLFLVAGVALAGDSAPSIKWHQYDEGMALAKSQNKLAVIDFGADWCGACKELDETTFSDEDVISLQDRCVFIRVDVDRDYKAVDAYFGENVKAFGFTLMRRPHAITVPKVAIADSQGKVILMMDFMSAEDLIRSVKEARP